VIVDPNLGLVKSIDSVFNDIVEVDFSFDNKKIMACGTHPLKKGIAIYDIATSALMV